MRLMHLLRKEVLQMRRDPVILRMILIMPLAQTLLLSYAANMDVLHVPLLIVDQDRSPESRDLAARCTSTESVILRGYRGTVGEAEADLEAGRATLALIMPSGMARDLERGTATVQILADGSESTTAGVAAGYLSRIIAAFGIEAQTKQALRRGRQVKVGGMAAEPRVLYNPDLRTLWFMAPAVLALVLIVLMQNITSLSIARERELGTLDQLMMTPVRSWEVLLAKLVPVGVLGLVAASVVTMVVIHVIGVPFRGSAPTLMVSTVFFLFSVLGLGLLVSALSQNQQQAQLVSFFLTFPSMLLSGFIFPVWNLPALLKPFAYLVPMTHYLTIVRGTFLRGAGLGDLWVQLLGLALLSALFFITGAKLFTKKPA